MAYRRTLTANARFFSRQRFSPSISRAHEEEDDRKHLNIPHSDEKVKRFLQSRSSLGFGGGNVSLRDPKWSQFLHLPTTTTGILLTRNMSTSGEKNKNLSEIADGVADKVMEVGSAPAVSEVAVAAADSWLPVAAMQYAIDGIHNFTGLNWWASIVITTLVIKTLSLPMGISERRATTKLNLLKPEIEQYLEDMLLQGMTNAEVGEEMKKVDKKLGVNDIMFTQMKWLLLRSLLYGSFFFAIMNMVKKVPSFQTGGVSWFTDLTTADSLYILPFLIAFSSLINIELNVKASKQHDRTAKNIIRGLTVLSFPLAACLPKAVLCCWFTSNLFELLCSHIMKKPAVKKLLESLLESAKGHKSTN